MLKLAVEVGNRASVSVDPTLYLISPVTVCCSTERLGRVLAISRCCCLNGFYIDSPTIACIHATYGGKLWSTDYLTRDGGDHRNCWGFVPSYGHLFTYLLALTW